MIGVQKLGIQLGFNTADQQIIKENSIGNIFDNIPSMQSPFIQTLQKFQYTASSQNPPDSQIPSITTQHIFMKTCKQSSPSSALSFNHQKSCLHTQTFTHSRSTSTTHVVENICNQIKYLIEGNLRSNNTESTMMDFVRESIIPMLIKMFFQPSKTEHFIKQNSDCPIQQLKDITNNFGSKINSWNTQTFNAKESSQGFHVTAKSDLIPNIPLEEQQYLDNQLQINTKNLFPQWSQSTQLLNQQQSLTKTLCLSILLLKTLVVKKSFSFQQIKTFSQQKQKKILLFVNLVKQFHLKKCVDKFYINKIQTQKQALVVKIKQQSIKFNQKQRHLSCQVIAKILKIRLRNNFSHFKDISFAQNKWMRQWIRNAALRSPLTVKTSIWRLQQFLDSESKKDEVVRQNNVSKESVFEEQKVTEPQASEINSGSEESISSNEFQKMFQEEQQEKQIQEVQRISIQIMAIKSKEKEDALQCLVVQKKAYEDEEYLRTISEDQQESLTALE